MKPAPFTYHAPETIEEALSLLAEHGSDANLLAGGQSLVPMMNFRLAQPAVLIDLNGIGELSFLREDESGDVLCGAMTRQRTLERHPLIQDRLPLIRETMPYIAHPPIRNRGTIGGSIAHADPSAELPALMLVHDARFRLKSAADERWVDASDFFQDLFFTDREPDELLVEIAIPRIAPRSGWAFEEFARRHGDFALAGVAATVTLDEQKRCIDARIGMLSVDVTPVLAVDTAKMLVGERFSEDLLKEAFIRAAGPEINPVGDLHASEAYRRHLARVFTERVLRKAFERAQASFE